MIELALQEAVAKHVRELQPLSGRGELPVKEDHVFLSYGSPDAHLFPADELGKAAGEVFSKKWKKALQYHGGDGPNQLKNWIIERMNKRKMSLKKEAILMTAGAAQAIDYVTRLFLDVGDHVWVEKPSYFFALQSFKLAGASIRMCKMDANGIDVEDLEKKLRERRQRGLTLPKLLYVMPNYHNPTSITLGEERRERLARLAEEYDFYILEDDAYVEVSFKENKLPSIASFAPDRVLYIGTFSKIIAPGIRLGWVAAAPYFIQKMTLLQIGPEVNPMTQEIIGHFLQDFVFERHINHVRKTYEEKRVLMVQAIKTYFGDDVTFHLPLGGFFIWLRFMEPIQMEAFLERAFHEGVSVLPCSHFYEAGEADRQDAVRLSYSFPSHEEIDLGIRRLAKAFYDY